MVRSLESLRTGLFERLTFRHSIRCPPSLTGPTKASVYTVLDNNMSLACYQPSDMGIWRHGPTVVVPSSFSFAFSGVDSTGLDDLRIYIKGLSAFIYHFFLFQFPS